MVRRVLFLTAMFMGPVSPFVLPINDKKNDEPISIEEISLGGHKNAALVERITKTLTNSFEDVDSEEKNKKSIEVAISISNIRKKDQDDDTDDMKDKSIPGKHNECADGMIYLSELDICVPWNPSPFHPSKTTNIYDIPQGDSPIPYSAPQTSTHDKDQDCEDDEIYLSELDICAPASPAKPLPPKTRTSIYDIMQGDAPAKLTDSSERRVPNKKPSYEDNECGEGEIYLSELDICAPASPSKPLPPKTRTSIYDIMQGDAPAKLTDSSERRVPNKKPTYEDNECDEGEIYLSELDICAPASPAKPLPPKTRTASIYDIMQGDAPAKLTEAEDSNELRVPNKKPNKKPNKEDNECDEGEIYLSELDICAPHHPAAPLPPKPRSPSIYDIMQGDAPQAAPLLTESEPSPRRKKAPKKHKSTKCGKGQLYLSELGICVPYNNCFPYGNTC